MGTTEEAQSSGQSTAYLTILLSSWQFLAEGSEWHTLVKDGNSPAAGKATTASKHPPFSLDGFRQQQMMGTGNLLRLQMKDLENIIEGSSFSTIFFWSASWIRPIGNAIHFTIGWPSNRLLHHLPPLWLFSSAPSNLMASSPANWKICDAKV